MTNTITPAMRDAGAEVLKASVGWLSTAAGLFYVAHKVYATMESVRLRGEELARLDATARRAEANTPWNTPPREARPGDWAGKGGAS